MEPGRFWNSFACGSVTRICVGTPRTMPVDFRGATAATSNGRPLSMMLLCNTAGSPPNTRCHKKHG
jgi:hypothetical protein